MSESDLFWVAGLLDGEGSFTLGAEGSGSNRLRQIRITCAMTDLDTLQRLEKLLGGHISKTPRIDKRYNNPKPLWVWNITKRAEVVPILEELHPLMSIRRQNQIAKLLRYADTNKPIYGVQRHGTKNMYTHRGCRCDDCRKAVADYARNLRAAKKAAN